MRAANGLGGDPRAVAGQLARAVEIATILSASGFDWLVQALGLKAWVSSGRLVRSFRRDTKCPPRVAVDVPLPERLRLMEGSPKVELGATYLYVGSKHIVDARRMHENFIQDIEKGLSPPCDSCHPGVKRRICGSNNAIR